MLTAGGSESAQAAVGADGPVSTDVFVLAALASGDIRVDVATGEIRDRDGRRVECLARGGGRVLVQRTPRRVWAPAHRVVWLAAEGEIPGRLVVRHLNGRRWDNRRANLFLSGQRGCVRYSDRAAGS